MKKHELCFVFIGLPCHGSVCLSLTHFLFVCLNKEREKGRNRKKGKRCDVDMQRLTEAQIKRWRKGRSRKRGGKNRRE